VKFLIKKSNARCRPSTAAGVSPRSPYRSWQGADRGYRVFVSVW